MAFFLPNGSSERRTNGIGKKCSKNFLPLKRFNIYIICTYAEKNSMINNLLPNVQVNRWNTWVPANMLDQQFIYFISQCTKHDWIHHKSTRQCNVNIGQALNHRFINLKNFSKIFCIFWFQQFSSYISSAGKK